MKQLHVPILLAALLGACANPESYRPNRDLRDDFKVQCEGDFDQPPSIVAGKSPVYPIKMLSPDVIEDREIRRLPMKWSVRSTFIVTEGGKTADVRATVTDPPSFGQHVNAAVTAWRFEPATKTREPVRARCSTRFEFTLH